MATLTITSPTTTSPGSLLEFSGVDFQGLSTITVNVDGSPFMETTVTSGLFGDISGSIRLSASISSGTHQLAALQNGGAVATASFNVNSAGASLSIIGTGTGNNTVIPGNTITCTLTGYTGTFFPAITNLTIPFVLDSSSLLDSGAPHNTPVWVWRIATDALAGTYTISVIDSSGALITSSQFVVKVQPPAPTPTPVPTPSPAPTPTPTPSPIPTASITITPTSGTPGTTVTIHGSSFTPLSTIGIMFSGTSVDTDPLIVSANAFGSFTASFNVPTSAYAGLQAIVRAYSVSNSSVRADAIFTVTGTPPVPTPTPAPTPTPSPNPAPTPTPAPTPIPGQNNIVLYAILGLGGLAAAGWYVLNSGKRGKNHLK